MKKSDLEEVLAVVRDAAREAGELVLRGFRSRPSVEHKGEVDLVTEFDRASEALLRLRLQRELPFPVVGEEEGGQAPEGVASFFVDPVDGTTNFVHGHPFWCVSVGLVAGDTPLLGVVVAPVLGLEWFGWIAETGERLAVRRPLAGGGLAGGVEEACNVSSTDAFRDALLATGFPYDRRTSDDNNFDAFVAIKKRVQAVRRCGSAALDLCMVADGTYEGYWERKLKPWDIAAGTVLVEAAGGRVTDVDGSPQFMTTGSVVATNGAIHDALVAELARIHGSSMF